MSAISPQRTEELLRPSLAGQPEPVDTQWFAQWSDYWRDTTVPALVHQGQRLLTPADPNWRPTEQDLELASEGIDTDLLPMLENADSEHEMFLISARMRQIQEGRQRLAHTGLTSGFLKFAAMAVDPAFLLPGVGAARVASAPAKVAQLTRGARFGRSFAIYGGVDTAVMSYNASQYPDLGVEDVLLVAVASGTLGGAIQTGAINRSMAVRVRQQKNIEFSIAVRDGHWATIRRDPELRAYFKEQLESARLRNPKADDGVILDMPEGRFATGERPQVEFRQGGRWEQTKNLFRDAWRGEARDLGQYGDDITAGLDSALIRGFTDEPADPRRLDGVSTPGEEPRPLFIDTPESRVPNVGDVDTPPYRLDPDTGDIIVGEAPLIGSLDEPAIRPPKSIVRATRKVKGASNKLRERLNTKAKVDKDGEVRVARDDEGWRNLEGHLTTSGYAQWERNVIRLALKDVDPENLRRFRFSSNPKQGAEGRARVRTDAQGRQVGDVEISVRPDAPTMGRVMTLLHEVGHGLSWTVLDTNDWRFINRVYTSKTKAEWARWFERGQQNVATARKQGRRLASNESEFFAQSFVEWVLTGRLAQPNLLTMFRKILDQLRGIFSRLRERGMGDLEQLVPVFEKMLKGRAHDDLIRDTFEGALRAEAGQVGAGIVSRAASGASQGSPSPVPKVTYEPGDFRVGAFSDEIGFRVGNTPLGLARQLMHSPDALGSMKTVPPVVREMNSIIFGTLARGPKASERFVLGENALTASHRIRMNVMADFNVKTNRAYAGWRKAHGKTLRDRARIEGGARDQFMEEVFEANKRRAWSSDPHVKDAQKAAAEATKHVHEIATRHGLPGFEHFSADEFYLPWLFSKRRILQFDAKHGHVIGVNGQSVPASTDLIYQALVSARPAWRPQLADEVSRIIRNKIINEDAAQSHIWMTTHQRADLKKFLYGILKDDIQKGRLGATPGEVSDNVNAIVRAFRPNSDDARLNPRARRRTSMDRTSDFTLSNGATVTLSDLVENNAQQAVSNYARSVIGDAVMQPVYRHAEVRLGRKAGTIGNETDLRAAIEADLNANGIDIHSGSHADNALTLMDTMIGRVQGKPLDEPWFRRHPRTREFLDLMHTINFARLSGRFGFASVPEIFRSIAIVNFDTAMNGVPEIPRIIGDMLAHRTSTPRHFGQFFDRGAAAVGIGWDANAPIRFLGAQGNQEVIADVAGGGMQALTHLGRKANRPLSAASGLPFVTDFAQRWAHDLIIDDIVRKALGGRKVTDAYLDRIGMDRKMWDRVVIGINNAKTPAHSQTGAKYMNLDVANWADGTAQPLESLGAMATGSYRFAVRQILQPEASDYALFAQGTLGKTLFQFRAFSMASNDKLLIQTYRDVLSGDAAALRAAGATTAVAAGVYVAQTQLESLGQKDPQAYLQERLTPDRIAITAFYRSGFLGMLPDAVESASRGLTGYSVFTGARQTGLTLDPFRYNPTQDFVYDASGAMQGVFKALTGQGYTSEDAANIIKVLPGHRLPGIMEAMQAAGNQLPSRSDQ